MGGKKPLGKHSHICKKGLIRANPGRWRLENISKVKIAD